MDLVFKNRIQRTIQSIDTAEERYPWIVCNREVEALLQNGPQCGIVALCMALNSLQATCTVDELMTEAKQLGFTKNGEMFDIKSMLSLSDLHLPQRCDLIDIGDTEREPFLVERIVQSRIALLAYDCDANYEPCNRSGLKAHWALVTGLLLPLSTSLVEKYPPTDREYNVSYVNDALPRPHSDVLIADYPLIKERIYVVCKNGKSKHSGVWSLSKLLASNRQLTQIDSNKCSKSEYVWPLNGDLTQSLASKVLIFN